MKAGKIRRNILLSALGITCLFFSLSPAAQASVYIGELCWQSNLDDTIYRFAINDMGNYHYLINGKSTSANGLLMPISGSAELALGAGGVVLAMSFGGGSFGPSGTQTYTLNWTIDGDTGDGAGMGSLTRTNNQGQTSNFLIEDSLNFIACP
ncbi:MAG: hypothetical protein HZB33_10475 [Nitrospirae bacterium]|nr:hypothetical protein [Nitrospirota bacterium]